MLEKFHASRARLHDMTGAHYTAVALANGAALITIGGIIGNVDDPNFAFRALAPALALYGLGLISAVTALQTFSLALSYQLHVDVAEARMSRLLAEAATPLTDPFAPVDLSGAKLIYGEKAEEEFRRFVLAKLLSEKNAHEKRDKQVEEVISDISSSNAKVYKGKVGANRWLTFSVCASFLATIFLFHAGYSGFQPQGAAAASSAVTSSAGKAHLPKP